jgi:hypothetical protein
VSVAEVLDWQAQVRADPDFDPDYALLADYSDAATIDFDTRQLRRIAQNAPIEPTARRAFVIRTDAITACCGCSRA